VRGLELSATVADAILAETGIEVIVADFLEYDSDDISSYDVVILRHVLEHLSDPLQAMQKIRKLLKPGGHAMLEFPNTASVSYMLKRVLKNHGFRNKKYSADWRPGHCNEFCRQSFVYLLSEVGLNLVDWETYSSRLVANMIYGFFPFGSKARALISRPDET